MALRHSGPMTTSPTNALREGDTLTVVDDVDVGDVVYFERLSPTSVVARVMTEDLLPSFTGPLFTLSGIHQSGEAYFQVVSRDDLNFS